MLIRICYVFQTQNSLEYACGYCLQLPLRIQLSTVYARDSLFSLTMNCVAMYDYHSLYRLLQDLLLFTLPFVCLIKFYNKHSPIIAGNIAYSEHFQFKICQYEGMITEELQAHTQYSPLQNGMMNTLTLHWTSHIPLGSLHILTMFSMYLYFQSIVTCDDDKKNSLNK